MINEAVIANSKNQKKTLINTKKITIMPIAKAKSDKI